MSAQAEHIEALAAEAEMYQQDATAFNFTQRAEHHKEVAEVLRAGVRQRAELIAGLKKALNMIWSERFTVADCGEIESIVQRAEAE